MFGDAGEKTSHQVVPTHNFCAQGHNQDRAGYVIRVSNSEDLDELPGCDHDAIPGATELHRIPTPTLNLSRASPVTIFRSSLRDSAGQGIQLLKR